MTTLVCGVCRTAVMSRSIVIIGYRSAFQYLFRCSLFHSCGIIGSTTAYYLTRHPKFGPNISVHVLEATAVAAGSVSLVYYIYRPFIESISAEPRAKLAASSQRTGMAVRQPLWLRSPSTYTMSSPRNMEEIRNGGTAASKPSR